MEEKGGTDQGGTGESAVFGISRSRNQPSQ
jgi:hypothetical protein